MDLLEKQLALFDPSQVRTLAHTDSKQLKKIPETQRFGLRRAKLQLREAQREKQELRRRAQLHSECSTTSPLERLEEASKSVDYLKSNLSLLKRLNPSEKCRLLQRQIWKQREAQMPLKDVLQKPKARRGKIFNDEI